LLLFSIIIIIDGCRTDCSLRRDSLQCSGITQLPDANDWSIEPHQNAFNWSEIRKLLITNNGIKSFKNGFFHKFNHAEEISLDDNELKLIDFNEFSENIKLVTLSVSNNQISEITPIKTATDIKIIKLEAQDNDLTDISELCKLTRLTVLHLSRNQRLDYSNVMFNCWSELTQLYLADTNLKHLNHDYRVLTGCNTLRFLNLKDNNLETLSFENFPVLSKLRYLDIENNSLIELDVQELKRSLPSLLMIVIISNKWSCDYYETSLKVQLEKFRITDTTYTNEDVICLNGSVKPRWKLFQQPQKLSRF
jgi:Leucine-rich repeat (LRR) protein